jgi:DNA invertase Pin-like site-specific DNA recombinase
LNPKKLPAARKRAVCYVRISVDRDDETSTQTQSERVRAYCKAHGWPIVDVIVEPGRSAYRSTRTSRPGFKRVMGLIDSGAANVLVVWKLDRAERNTEGICALVRELAERGAQFVSVTEQFDTATASGRMMLQVLASLAEMESATKSERTKAWQDHRRTNGGTPTGPRPFGYQRERNRLIVDKAEAAVIRRAARAVLAGKSFRSIVRDLDAAGVRGKNGRAFTARTLQGILLGPTIAACREVSPGVYVDSTEWRAILDRATWDAVRAVLTDPARRTSPSNARRWLLAGIVRCGRCHDNESNGWMRSMPHRAGTRYHCPTCALSIHAERTEECVVAALLDLLDPKAWKRLRQGRPSGGDHHADDAIAALYERHAAGDIDGVELDRLIEALRRQSNAMPRVTLPDAVDLKKAWPKLTLEQRRLVLSAATESLTILPWMHKNGFDDRRVEWTPVI